MRRLQLSLAGVLLAAMFSMLAGPASAAGLKVCVPEKENAPIKTPKGGTCPSKYTLTELGAEGKEGPAGKEGLAGKEGPPGKEGAAGKEGKEGKEGKQGKEGKEGKTGLTTAELETLKGILPHIKYVPSGIGGKPTVQFSGVNVQVVSGSGSTNGAVNGEGNLVIGYDENPEGFAQTGSHDLILGQDQTFTSFGGILAGFHNTIGSEYASVTGGDYNVASGEFASVTGGEGDAAQARDSWVSGGGSNRATEAYASTSGGYDNSATAEYSSVTGGKVNTALGEYASVTGGEMNLAEGYETGVEGGAYNHAEGAASAVLGGFKRSAKKEYETIP